MTILVAVDPGWSTGLIVGKYSEDDPLKITDRYQIEGGVEAFSGNYKIRSALNMADVVISEKFTPLQSSGFNLTMRSVEPLRVEGWLVGKGFIPDYPGIEWQRPDAMYFTGGSGVKDKRKRAKQFLKDIGMYVTGSKVGAKDAEDVISATLHALAYMHKIGHLPTLNAYFRED